MYTDINTILYASDLGENTRPAFHLAIDLAKKYDAQIIFLYVVEPINANAHNSVSPEVWKEIIPKAFKEAEDRVKERITNFFAEEIPEGTNVKPPKALVVRGRITETILRSADKEDADLIIMGQHKRSALGELIIGSAADKVVHHSKIPVIAVPI